MNQQITDDNKLIAEFDGWKPHPTIKGVYLKGEMTLSGNDSYTTPLFSYHTNWNLLMPVVEKVNNIECRRFNTLVMQEIVRQVVGKGKVEVVYKAVVAFIKWHNKENE